MSIAILTIRTTHRLKSSCNVCEFTLGALETRGTIIVLRAKLEKCLEENIGPIECKAAHALNLAAAYGFYPICVAQAHSTEGTIISMTYTLQSKED